MALSLQKFREIVFYLLYSFDFGGSEEAATLIMQQLVVPKSAVRRAQTVLEQICQKQADIDQLIAAQSKEYEFERIPRIERTILRLSIFEILFSPTTPPKVAIAEAIRLSRKFASPESAAFVNAILDAIYHDSLALPLQMR